jgi:hypothetical protein
VEAYLVAGEQGVGHLEVGVGVLILHQSLMMIRRLYQPNLGLNLQCPEWRHRHLRLHLQHLPVPQVLLCQPWHLEFLPWGREGELQVPELHRNLEAGQHRVLVVAVLGVGQSQLGLLELPDGQILI